MNLIRLKEKLVNTPHLVSSELFDAVMDVVNSHSVGKYNLSTEDDNEDDHEDDKDGDVDHENGVGTLNIHGALTYRPTAMQMLCGGTSYMGLLNKMQSFVEAGCKVVVMDVDSGGGEAFSMFETGKLIRKMADENGIRLVTYVDGTAASAGYGLCCVADEVIAHPSANVGSIGVVIQLMNDSEALKKEGIERSFVYSGDSKIPFDSNGKFTEEFIKDLQYKTDALYSDFIKYVSEFRGISEKAVRDTKAKTFLSKDALQLGLIDKVMTKDEFYSNHLPLLIEGMKKENKPMNFKFGKSTPSKPEMADVEELRTQLADLASIVEEKEKMVDSFKSQLAEMVAEKESLQKMIGDMKKQQLEDKNASRKVALAQVVAQDKLEATFESLQTLDDTSFATVLSTLEMNYKAEQTSALFTEKGVAGESTMEDIVPSEEESPEMKIIKHKYSK